MEDEGYFSDCLDYSETGKDFEAPISKTTPVHKNLDDFSGVSHAYDIFSPRCANIIECKSRSDLNFKKIFSMYPVFFLKKNQ